MARPNLFAAFSWEDFEDYVIDVFVTALKELRKRSDLLQAEDLLNRELRDHCLRANWQLNREGNGLPMTILLDSTNQPQPDDTARAARLRKKPDFQCLLFNAAAAVAEESQVFFGVECKRLGEPERPDWVFNRNYALHGMLRFRSPDHGYAKGFASAAMVGYIQSMNPNDILTEVNAFAATLELSAVPRPRRWSMADVTRLGAQRMERPFSISPMTLHHLWVDLRQST